MFKLWRQKGLFTSGYKTNKSGFKFGTEFEYYNDFNIGLASSIFTRKFLQTLPGIQ